MTDLDKLIAAVEAAGVSSAENFTETAVFSAIPHGVFSHAHINLIWQSYDGSLDAAHRLHEALLPGWAVENLGNAVIDGTGGWNVRLVAPDYLETFAHSTANAATPARSWLLAILRALKAQGGDA